MSSSKKWAIDTSELASLVIATSVFTDKATSKYKSIQSMTDVLATKFVSSNSKAFSSKIDEIKQQMKSIISNLDTMSNEITKVRKEIIEQEGASVFSNFELDTISLSSNSAQATLSNQAKVMPIR